MSEVLLDLYRGDMNDLPETMKDGAVYFAKDAGVVWYDVNNGGTLERRRVGEEEFEGVAAALNERVGFDSTSITSPSLAMDNNDHIVVNHDTSESNTLANLGDIWGVGTPISPLSSSDFNAEMNNYTSPGLYYCANANICALLSHAPYTDHGFRLVVDSNYGGFIKQSAYYFGLEENEHLESEYANRERVRYYDPSISKWSGWQEVLTMNTGASKVISNNVQLNSLGGINLTSHAYAPESSEWSADLDMQILDGVLGTTPSETRITPVIRMRDASGNPFGRIYGRYHDDGKVSLSIGVTWGTAHTNSFAMYTDASGNNSVSFNYPDAWLTGLGITNVLITRTYSASASIAAGDHHEFTASNFSISAVNNYTPIGIVSYTSNSSNSLIYYTAIPNGTPSQPIMRVHNMNTSAAVSTNITITVLYIKSIFVS